MEKKEISILLIEDDSDDTLLIRDMLEEAHSPYIRFRMQCVERLDRGLERLASEPFDVVLLDLSLPDSTGLETFTKVYGQVPAMPIVVLTGFDDDAAALEAVRMGAQDYLVKSHVHSRVIVRVILYAIERKKLQQLKDEFVSTVSHELRTPLSIIKSAISNLKGGVLGSLPDKQREVVEMTSRNVNRLARLINDLLDLSRLESGKAKVNRKRFDPVRLIQETLQTFNGAAEERGILLETDSPQKLPSIYGDPDLVMQVLTNLLENALRFAKSRVAVKAELQGTSRIKISVIDDGEGIKPEDIGKLFNKFEQIERPIGGAGYKGTGLGLTICKKIVELHQGNMGVESVVGAGSRFHFTLPAVIDKKGDKKGDLS